MPEGEVGLELLTKTQLIIEVVKARARVEALEEILSEEAETNSNILHAYLEKVKHDEERLDKTLEKQSEILDSRLGLGQRTTPLASSHKPIQLRKPWKNEAANFERKDRLEHWQNKIKEVEEQDAKSQNDTTVASSPDNEHDRDVAELSEGTDARV